MLAFSSGADLNTDDGAQLEFSAPKSVRRATSELNRKLMESYFSEAPWLKVDSVRVSEAMRRYYLAQAYEANDWHSRALQEVDRAIDMEPSNADFYVLKTKILLEEDRSAPAAKAALLAMERSRQAINPILGLSEEFYLNEAKTVYSKAIELGAREVLPYLGIGNIALHYKDLKEAEKWFEQARQIKSDHPAVLLSWGRLMLAKGEAKEAKALLEKSKEKGEDSSTLYGALGETYFKLGLWEEATGSYRQALKYRKKNHEWRRALGTALAKMGRVSEAEVKYRDVLALNSDDAEAWRELKKLGKRY